jgi:Hint domain
MTSQSSRSIEVCSRTTSTGCFAKGTLVRTPRGMFPIEGLQSGEEVITHDSRIARIHKAHVAIASELVRVTFSDGSYIVSTPWHRFFELRGSLIKAEALLQGTYVRNYDDSVAQVQRVEKVAQGVANDVFNLSLERDVGFFANGKLVEAPHANRILDTRSLLTRAS